MARSRSPLCPASCVAFGRVRRSSLRCSLLAVRLCCSRRLRAAVGAAGAAICCIFRRGRRSRRRQPAPPSNAPMLVQATEIRYDYTNNTVAAVGNVQIYYGGATIEADKVIYDQKTKRLRAARQRPPDRGGRQDHLRADHRSQRRLSRRLRRFAAARNRRRHALCRGPRRPRQRQLHGAAKRRLHRLRALQGRSEEAAAVAGSGGADHPRRGREDALFRGRPRRVLRRAARLFAVHVGARSDREAQERLSVSEHHYGHSPYGFGIEVAIFLGARAELRPDLRADAHDQAGRAVRGRMAPASAERLLLDHAPPASSSWIPGYFAAATVPAARPRTRSAAPSRPRASSRSTTNGCGAGPGC